MYHLNMAWFAAAACSPRARIELNFTETIKSLVAAGYGAAVLPMEQAAISDIDRKMQVIPLRPKLARHIGMVHRPLPQMESAALNLLQILAQFKQLKVGTGR
jgi:DNA-binding transcriptional LysR family regulator